MNKMMSQSLDTETAYRAFLVRHGFERSGIQREAMYATGHYHNLESWALFRTRYQEMTAAT